MRTKEDRLIDLLEAPHIRQYAKLQRRNLGWQGSKRVDPLSLVAATEIWTIRGVSPFSLKFWADEAMPGYSPDSPSTYGYSGCHTRMNGSRFVVKLPVSIRQRAFLGDGYARFVIAVQVAHATLRHPETLKVLKENFFRQPETRDARKVAVSAMDSINFQAGVFAAALLIDDDTARGFSSLQELSIRAGIDPLSARVYFAEIAEAGAHLREQN